MTTQLLALFKLDLLMTGTYTIQSIECPYSPTDGWHEAMTRVYNATRQTSQRQRIKALVYAYYMGKLIELSITPREKWLEFVNQKSISNE
jgi:hypothetical protein